MSFYYLPKELRTSLEKLDLSLLYEIRLRVGFFIQIEYGNSRKYLLDYENDKPIICTREIIDEIIDNLTEKSFYAFNEYIKKGYLTSRDGHRIGLCGECVLEKGQVVTIKNYSSINVRIPHLVKDCSKKIFEKIFSEKIFNTLIISPPFYGKTTMLKDLSIKINERFGYNILIIDERGEFSSVKGENIDKISYSSKDFAYYYGVRNISPNLIIMDELVEEIDWLTVKMCVNSGVKVIASCHGSDKNSLLNNRFFSKNYFERYVFLTKTNGLVKEVFLDNNFYEL